MALETQVSLSSDVHKCSVFAIEEYILEELFLTDQQFS